MRKILITLALIAGTQASAQDYDCNVISEFGQSVAKAREDGIPKSVLLNRIYEDRSTDPDRRLAIADLMTKFYDLGMSPFATASMALDLCMKWKRENW